MRGKTILCAAGALLLFTGFLMAAFGDETTGPGASPAPGDYAQRFASVNSGGSVAQSADYEAADRIEPIPETVAIQKSEDYTVLDVLAQQPAATPTGAKNWAVYE